VFGVLFAVIIGRMEAPLDRLLFPLFVALNSVPKVALAPLFIIWFGTGAEPKIAIAFLIAGVCRRDRYGARPALGAAADTLDLARTLRGSRLNSPAAHQDLLRHAAPVSPG